MLLNALDGAATAATAARTRNHIDNANMYTPPDGTPPTMQMYLWHLPGATDAQEPCVPASGANDASILYHEYTHGLSNRLVVDADRQLDAEQHPGRLDGRGVERLLRDGLPGLARPGEGHHRSG